MKRPGRFRKLTPRQRELWAVLKEIGEVTVQPNDARPLKALHRRGWIKYRRDADGARVAILKAAHMRRHCPWRVWDWWGGCGPRGAVTPPSL